MFQDPYITKLNNKHLRHHFQDSAGRIHIDHADTGLKDATYYTGSQLTAKKPIQVLSGPNGTLLRTVQTGDYIGHIYSYVERDGKIWWQLKGGGFVLHGPGFFDTKVALDTSDGKEHEEELLKLKENPIDDVLTGVGSVASGVGKTLSSLGTFLPLIIIGVVLLAAVYLFKGKTISA